MPIFPGGGNALLIERFSVLFLAADKEPDEDLRGVVEIAFAEKTSVVGAYAGERAVFVFAFDAGDFVGVYPAMPREQSLFFVFFEINRIGHGLKPRFAA